MRARTATSVVAIGLLAAGFAAFVLLAGDRAPGGSLVVSGDSGGTDDADRAVEAAEPRNAGDPRPGRGNGEPDGGGAAIRDVGVPSGIAEGGAPGDDATASPDPDGGGELGDRMRKLARDLEFTRGLPEPPQQIVMPQPEPWRPDPVREGPPPEIAAVVPARGPVAGGGRVEIRGRNLRVVSVMFGTASARLLSATGSLVAVEAPEGSPGPVTIALTNEDGTWGVAAEPYVYGQ